MTTETTRPEVGRAAAVARLHATGYRIKGISHNRSQLFLTPEQINAIAEIIEKGDAK